MTTETKPAVSELIKKAIGAHGMWKERLKAAIRTRKGDITVEQAGRDDRCEFGKWLNEFAEGNTSPHLARIKELHRAFHHEVAAVLLAVRENRGNAEELLGIGSPFAHASALLTAEMLAWAREAESASPHDTAPGWSAR